MTILRQLLLASVAAAACQVAARSDTFGTGENAFTIDFVTIGHPGNPADTVTPINVSAPLPSGTVNYTYRMAKYEISEEIIARVNQLSSADGDPLNLSIDIARGPQRPATGLSWFDAARFANWLNEDQGFAPAYKFDDQGEFQLWEPGDLGYNPNNPFRNTRARYALPSADEWHKAAYYDPVNERYWLYPYGSDEPPIAVASGTDPGTAVYNQSGPADVMLAGGESLFGVVGMAGNVYEFEETTVDLLNLDAFARRGANGGTFNSTLAALASDFRNSGGPFASQSRGGIRIVSVPEPNCLLMILLGLPLLPGVFRKRA
jgi:formylglycine-generating enzyme required for sulfatase activity